MDMHVCESSSEPVTISAATPVRTKTVYKLTVQYNVIQGGVGATIYTINIKVLMINLCKCTSVMFESAFLVSEVL